MSERTTKDLRSSLYDRYVSDFKQENIALSDAQLTHYYKWCDARLMPFIHSLPKNARILELGCGHGKILSYLDSRGYSNASGVDISEEQIAIARSRGLSAEVGDIFAKLEAARDIDCMIAIDLVEHFTKDELYSLYSSVHGALAPGGLFLIQTVNGEGLFPRQIIYGDLTHMTIFTPGSMSQLLRATGFRNTEMIEATPITSGAKGALRGIVWSLVKCAANTIRKIEAAKNQRIWTENFITAAWRE